MKKIFLLAFVVLGAAPSAFAGGSEKVVVLPFQNVSGVERAVDRLVPRLEKILERRGYALIRGEAVESLLERDRVRHLDSLPSEVRARLLDRLGAGAVLSGTIYTYQEGDNPVIALSARMIRGDARVLWWNVVGLSPGDTEGLLGLGRAATTEDLEERAVARLARDLPRPGERQKAGLLGGAPLRLSGPRTFRSAALASAGVRRVCVLPFENFTDSRQAPRLVVELLSRWLTETGRFEVVEAGDLRAGMVAEKIRSFRDGDPAALEKLGKILGTDLFLRGTIYTFRETSARGAGATPELDLELDLVDVRAGRVLWTSSHARKGEDYRALFERGAISGVVSLSDRVLQEIVHAEEKAAPRGAPAIPPNKARKGQVMP